MPTSPDEADPALANEQYRGPARPGEMAAAFLVWLQAEFAQGMKRR
jgi:hypothetical protein